MIAAIVATHGMLSLLNAFQIYSIHWLGNRVVVDLRTDVYAKLQELTMTFYDKRQTGWIMSRVTNDTSFLQHFMVHGLQQIIVHLLMITGITIVLFSMNWKLALLDPLAVAAGGRGHLVVFQEHAQGVSPHLAADLQHARDAGRYDPRHPGRQGV